MLTRRIAYALTLAGCAFFFVLYPYWFSWYLFALVMLLIPFDLLVSLPGMLTRRISMTAPYTLEQGAAAKLMVMTDQGKNFPMKCIKATLRVSCEDTACYRRIVVGAAPGSRYGMSIDTSRSGATLITLKRYWAVSLLGLFSVPISSKTGLWVLILPVPVRPPRIITLPRGVILRPKPGGGFSEEHDLRPYRQGDPLKSVHWKVSAKLDSLMIREPLVAPAHSRLVYTARWKGAAERDLILGRLRWVAGYMLRWELPFYVRLGEDGPVAEISRQSDLPDYLYNVLSGAHHLLPVPVSLPARFTWELRIDAKEVVK